jgi:NADP-dependent 3-hydroxy acid dehydrogenase YdfG
MQNHINGHCRFHLWPYSLASGQQQGSLPDDARSMRKFDSPSSILITGASSGIGAALALAYAGPGQNLMLSGRNATRLDAIAAQTRAMGASCETRIVDVRDALGIADMVTEANRRAPLDLVIANAGISAGAHKLGNFPDASDAELFATNVDGVVNTVAPALESMLERQHGQVAIMSSLASFRAFREAPAYCASKAAVRFYGAGLRRAHARDGVGVSVICPGFVGSPMTDANRFPMPMLMPADRAATIIHAKLTRNRGLIAFPIPMYFAVRALALF